MAHPGLLSWANSVRLTMATDPGRQAFKDQVQTIGFSFLDDYLDNIIAGAKQDPLIELVKTPGRKKIARKPKLKTSRLPNVNENDNDTENIAPINDFHKALLSVKPDIAKPADVLKHKSHNSSHDDTAKPPRAALQSIQPIENRIEEPIKQHVVAPPSHVVPNPTTLAPPIIQEHSDLSVIAEDEEPQERKRSSTATRQPSPIALPEPTVMPPPPSPSEPETSRKPSLQSRTEASRESGVVSNSSSDTFHSISLETPAESQDSKMADPIPPPEPEPLTGHEPPLAERDEVEDMIMDDPTGHHPQQPDDVQDTQMFDIDNTTSSLPKANEKPSFPTLPQPMPLRKSMRAPREPSMNPVPVMLGGATPGGPGKRTSWLAKAREANLHLNIKKSHPPVPPLPTLTSTFGSALMQGTKRKSGEMLAGSSTPREEQEEPRTKVPKASEGETASRKSKEKAPEPPIAEPMPETIVQALVDPNVSQDGVLNMLKKTVEGLGGRIGKAASKSVGGGAASALAEAKAAAEARLAERDRKEDEFTRAMGPPAASNPSTPQEAAAPAPPPAPSSSQKEGRLSVSDLFPKEGRIKEKHKVPGKVFHKASPLSRSPQQPRSPPKDASEARLSTSTTPPDSPPAQRFSFAQQTGNVFKPPVFVPPAPIFTAKPSSPVPKKDVFAFRPPTSPPRHNVPPSMALGFGPRVPSMSPKASKAAPAPLTAHSTLESIRSEKVFDTDTDDGPAWMPSTQETEYTSAYGSHSHSQPHTQVCDEDDSWPVDEKLAAGVQWTFGGGSKEDSMTWSTLPSQSQRMDTGTVTRTSPIREEGSEREVEEGDAKSGNETDVEMEDGGRLKRNEDAHMSRDEELEEIVLGSRLVKEKELREELPRSQSQMSMASSESAQSQTGFLGQASKFFSSALGTGKKKQPEVKKVFSKAAVAAKKQQEEQDKKASRMTAMEQRRQQALQRKAEEEKAKAAEEERKMKEDIERRKREREEHTDKRPFKPTAIKKQEDDTKKRKIEPVSVEKKPELKKPAPSSMLIGKSHLKSAMKKSTATQGSSTIAMASSLMTVESVKVVAPPQLKSKATMQSHKTMTEDELVQPSQLMHSQMAARAKAQIEASKNAIPSEQIDLPDINSEYSNSDDEGPELPDWAQSPELRAALESQSTIDPDNIFGPVPVLRMEEIFKGKSARYRARTSSANWNGGDRLTKQEEENYARRMGFTK